MHFNARKDMRKCFLTSKTTGLPSLQDRASLGGRLLHSRGAHPARHVYAEENKQQVTESVSPHNLPLSLVACHSHSPASQSLGVYGNHWGGRICSRPLPHA